LTLSLVCYSPYVVRAQHLLADPRRGSEQRRHRQDSDPDIHRFSAPQIGQCVRALTATLSLKIIPFIFY
jgi:hypothetical protein